MPFAEVKDFIKQKILQEKQTEMVQKYIEDLKKSSKIVINEGFFKEEAKQGEAPAKAEGAMQRLLLRTPRRSRMPARPRRSRRPVRQNEADYSDGCALLRFFCRAFAGRR